MSHLIDLHKARKERLARIERAAQGVPQREELDVSLTREARDAQKRNDLAIKSHDRTRELAIVPQHTFRLSPVMVIRRIKQATAKHYGITVADLDGPARTGKIVRARHLAMYLARATSGKSLPEIGRSFGDRDHTTVLHAIRNVPKRLEEDDRTFADAVDILIASDLPQERRRAGARALVKREIDEAVK